MQINNLLIDKLNQLKGIKCNVIKEELENPSNFVCSMLDNRPISETLDLIAKHLHCINCSYDEIIYLNKLQMCFKANDRLALYSKCIGYKSINGRKNFFKIFKILKKQQVFSESNVLIFALDDREEEKLRWVNEFLFPNLINNYYFFYETFYLNVLKKINSSISIEDAYKILITDLLSTNELQAAEKYYIVNKEIDVLIELKYKCKNLESQLSLEQSTTQPGVKQQLKGYTNAQLVLIFYYFFKQNGLEPRINIDISPIAKFIHLITGKEYKALTSSDFYKKLQTVPNFKTDKELINDLETIKPLFKMVQLNEVVKMIENEIDLARNEMKQIKKK